MSGFRGSALQVIRLGGSGDLEGSDAIVWTHNKNTPYVPSPMLYGNHLYFFSGNNAMLSIFDATTGKAGVEAERLDGLQGFTPPRSAPRTASICWDATAGRW